jgi:hypothetical protein
MKRMLVVLTASMALLILAPAAANAAIHEKIAAACRAGGEEVIPPGQVAFGSNSFLRALQASGVIESIDTSVPGQVTINFDLDKPSSKFMSAGFDLTIPDAFGPGVALILSPLPVLDPSFPGHANCHNLNS